MCENMGENCVRLIERWREISYCSFMADNIARFRQLIVDVSQCSIAYYVTNRLLALVISRQRSVKIVIANDIYNNVSKSLVTNSKYFI